MVAFLTRVLRDGGGGRVTRGSVSGVCCLYTVVVLNIQTGGEGHSHLLYMIACSMQKQHEEQYGE